MKIEKKRMRLECSDPDYHGYCFDFTLNQDDDIAQTVHFGCWGDFLDEDSREPCILVYDKVRQKFVIDFGMGYNHNRYHVTNIKAGQKIRHGSSIQIVHPKDLPNGMMGEEGTYYIKIT